MKSIIVVCTGNICRSPMAEGLLRDRLRAAGLNEKVVVRSAGIWGMDGAPASATGVSLLAERGIDISDHAARSLEDRDVAEADLILVMEEAHRRAIFGRMPEHLYKVLLFKELIGEHDDVRDPYGGDRRAYAAALRVIDETIEHGWNALLTKLGLETPTEG